MRTQMAAGTRLTQLRMALRAVIAACAGHLTLRKLDVQQYNFASYWTTTLCLSPSQSTGDLGRA